MDKEARQKWVRRHFPSTGDFVVMAPNASAPVEFVADLFADAIERAAQEPDRAYEIMLEADGGVRGYRGVIETAHERGLL